MFFVLWMISQIGAICEKIDEQNMQKDEPEAMKVSGSDILGSG